jgi:hypothetical protein
MSGPVILCYHCGNRTPHEEIGSHEAQLLFEQVDEKRFLEPYVFRTLACGTCRGLSLFGAFKLELEQETKGPEHLRRLYPRGPEITPEQHTVSPAMPVPAPVRRAYTDAWPLRHLNPAAFANQVRRCLEFVCEDKGASGRTLANKLRDLATRAVFPAELAVVADLLREVGNIGSHASAREIDVWDAELIDELFCLILRYVYLGPAHLQRMRERLQK